MRLAEASVNGSGQAVREALARKSDWEHHGPSQWGYGVAIDLLALERRVSALERFSGAGKSAGVRASEGRKATSGCRRTGRRGVHRHGVARHRLAPTAVASTPDQIMTPRRRREPSCRRRIMPPVGVARAMRAPAAQPRRLATARCLHPALEAADR
jgi:hypothetical protein